MYPLMYLLTFTIYSLYKPITETLVGTLVGKPSGLPEKISGYISGGWPPLTYPLTF